MAKGRRYWKFTTVDDQDTIDLLNRLVDGIINRTGKSENEVLNTIWVNTLLDIAKGNMPEITLNPVHQKIVEAKLKNVGEKYIMRDLIEVYEMMSHEEFLAWAKEDEIPEEYVERVVQKCSWRNPDMGWSSRADSWLRERLADGSPCTTEQIRQDAIATGLISQDPGDWSKLKQLAWRRGYTTSASYAEWKLPDLIQ